MKITERGRAADYLFLISPDTKSNGLNLMNIKDIRIQDSSLTTPVISCVSPLITKEPDTAPNIVIENERNVRTSSADLAALMGHSFSRPVPDQLPISFLRISLERAKQERGRNPVRKVGKQKHGIEAHYTDILRRIGLALSVFSFTVLGMAFSVEIGRNAKKKNFFIIFILTVFSLLCFFVGQAFRHRILLSYAVYFVPHLLILFFSFLKLRRISGGIE